MTATQFRDAIAQLDLSQEAAALFIGRSASQGQRWADGDPIPESVAKLLRLMVCLGLKPDDVR
jgi:hypothetical protein